MKRYLSLFVVLALMLSLLAGCGGGDKTTEAAAPEAAPAETWAAAEEVAEEEVLYDEADSGTGTTASAMPESQKLIRTVYMEAETLEMENLMPWLDSQVAALGGYYEQKSMHRSGSRDDGSYYQNADMIIRVPEENLDQFVSQVGEESNIVYTSESTENVTLQYVSTESRVEALETEQKRLLELLENAETMEDLLIIEERLTDVRWELENYASQLRVLENQVSYSTIHLSVWEVDEPTVIVERTVWQKIGDGFAENAGDLLDGLMDTFIWLVAGIPYWILLGALAVVAVLIGKRIRRKKKAKTEPKEEQK